MFYARFDPEERKKETVNTTPQVYSTSFQNLRRMEQTPDHQDYQENISSQHLNQWIGEEKGRINQDQRISREP